MCHSAAIGSDPYDTSRRAKTQLTMPAIRAAGVMTLSACAGNKLNVAPMGIMKQNQIPRPTKKVGSRRRTFGA